MTKIEITKPDQSDDLLDIPDAFQPDRIKYAEAYFVEDETLPYWIIRMEYDNGVVVDEIYYGDDAHPDEEVALRRGEGSRDFYSETDSEEMILENFSIAAFVKAGSTLINRLIELYGMPLEETA